MSQFRLAEEEVQEFIDEVARVVFVQAGLRLPGGQHARGKVAHQQASQIGRDLTRYIENFVTNKTRET